MSPPQFSESIVASSSPEISASVDDQLRMIAYLHEAVSMSPEAGDQSSDDRDDHDDEEEEEEEEEEDDDDKTMAIMLIILINATEEEEDDEKLGGGKEPGGDGKNTITPRATTTIVLRFEELQPKLDC